MKKIYFLIIGTFLIFSFSFVFLNRENKEEKTVEIISDIEEKEVEEEKILVKKAEIKGNVKNPGVYEINDNDRVINLIEKAGGLLKEADTSLINLSKILTDEMVVIIYSKEEIQKAKEEKTTYEIVEIPCKCPDTINDACIDEKESSKLININEATKEQLMSLPNIGESKADSIIEYRKNFKFETIEQIKEISGIGDSLFEKIKDFITV